MTKSWRNNAKIQIILPLRIKINQYVIMNLLTFKGFTKIFTYMIQIFFSNVQKYITYKKLHLDCEERWSVRCIRKFTDAEVKKDGSYI